MTNNELGIIFRRFRELKGYSQEYVALELGISQKAYSKLENNQTELNWTRILQLTQILEVDLLNVIHSEGADQNKGKFLDNKDDFIENLMSIYENRILRLENEVRALQSKESIA